MRELVGHANRAQTTVIDYLLHPQPPEPRGSAYFSEEAIAARGREAALALGEDAYSAVASSSEDAIRLVEQNPSDATIGSPARTMTLEAYLPSRIAELTIHALDIVQAIGVERTAPSAALAESLGFVGRLSAGTDGKTVLFALTGRGELPAGYSAY